MSNLKGKFINIEGVDAAGKTTQILYLQKYFKYSNKIIFTREPGGTALGDKIRKLLCEESIDEMLPLTELLLFNAARLEHFDKLIKPNLDQGNVVICDRFYDSSFVYQSFAGKVSSAIFHCLNNLILQNFTPDLTIILDIDTEIAAKRHANRDIKEDRFENFSKEYHKAVRKGYLNIAKNNKERCILIDADCDEKILHKKIIAIINKHIKL